MDLIFNQPTVIKFPVYINAKIIARQGWQITDLEQSQIV